MTVFAETANEAVARKIRARSRGRELLRVLGECRSILVTTHEHPDPDALASTMALCRLLDQQLEAARLTLAIKGRVGGGVNEIFVQYAGPRPRPWDVNALSSYDGIVLVDTQPPFSNNPLPANLMPTAVIDHHRSARGRRPKTAFADIRSDVGACSSIIFSYYMELGVPISRDLGATLLFAIESDLAGSAGAPGELDNMALSSLTLIADPRKLYRMRYAALPQSYFIAYAGALDNALYYEDALMSHLDTIESSEQPAVIADFLLRFDKARWALVTAVTDHRLVLSLRTNNARLSAADVIRRLIRDIGEGGGHRTKAGGVIPLANGTATEIERIRTILRRRYLRALGIRMSRGQRLIPKKD